MAAKVSPGTKKKVPTKGKVSAKRKVPTQRKTPVKRKAAPKQKTSEAKNNKGDGGYSDRSRWDRKPARAAISTSRRPLIKTLLAEHRHMASVMALFAEQMDAIEKGQLLDPHLVYEIMDYMVTWPDRFHHPREDLIYARVAELDVDGADEADTLQRDHDTTAKMGRELLRDIERWRQGDLSGNHLVKHGRAYVDHIYEHMSVEEKLVFPHIEDVLSSQDWRELEAEDQFSAVSMPIFGPRVQREFRNVARRLRRGVRRSVEQQTLSEWIGIEALMESVEVLSIAYDSSVHSAGEHARDALKEAAELVKDDLVTAPWRVATNNARMTLGFIGDVAEISREALGDLADVNRARMDRVRLLTRRSP
jgi:hemerythrin-like domain-containing protein